MKLKALFVLLAAALISGGCQKEMLTPQEQEQEQQTTFVMGAGEVVKGYMIVKFTDNTPQTKAIATTLPDMQISNIKRLFPEDKRFVKRERESGIDRWYVISYNPEIPLSQAYKTFKQMENVSTVEYIPVAKKASAGNPFNDPQLGNQWHYNNTAQKTGFVKGMDINLFKAWEIETGNPSVIVAVIDGGVDFNHNDIADNMWINKAEKNGRPKYDDDGNGFIDDIYGYNFIEGSDGSIEISTHGTHVAGTVAAVNNNGLHGCGVAGGNGTTPGVRIMTCAAVDDTRGSYPQMAFKYAADNGAVIAQNSWGLPGVKETPQSLLAAIDYFNKYAGYDENGNQVGPMAGGICIFASGNSNIQKDYPGMEENVLAVAATGPTGKKASYSNYGEWIDISAPGGEIIPSPIGYILSTYPNNDFGDNAGTSMACPHVSGVAALVVSKYGGPGFTNEMLWDRLIESADYDKLYRVNPDYKGKLGAGALDAYKALKENSIPNAVTNVSAEVDLNIVTLTWAATATNKENTHGYNVYYSKNDLSNYDPKNGSLEPVFVLGDSIKVGETVTCTLTNLEFDTKYFIRVQAVNIFNTGTSLSKQITVETKSNLPPVITPGEDITATLKSFEVATYSFTVSDPENGELKCTLDGGSDAASVKMKDNVFTVTIDAPKAEPGTYTATLTVTDDADASDSVKINYTILPNNAPKKVKEIGNVVLDKGENATLDLGEYFTDADGEQLQYEISITGTTSCTIQGNNLYLSASSYGSSTIGITAYDAKMAKTDVSSFDVLVRDKKQPLDVFPTTVTTSFKVRPATDSTIDIVATGASGATVYNATNIAAGPFKPHVVNTSDWSAGVYSVQITENGSKYTRTIVKM